MTEKFDDGGPAFSTPDIGPRAGSDGMRLWDYFAAHAPTPTEDEIEWERKKDQNRAANDDRYLCRERCKIIIDIQCKHADAMIAERRKHMKG